MTYIKAILAFIKALPIIRDMVVGIKKWWKAMRKEQRDHRFDDALDKAAKEKNTEDLQDELGRLT